MHVDNHLTPPGLSRADAKHQGREAVEISTAGGYVASSGRRVDLSKAVARAVALSRDYLPDVSVAAPAPVLGSRTGIVVVNGTSLASARAIAARGKTPLVLNFASAMSAGGGFLNGDRAQEESLARSSALYPCLVKSGMYAHHRASGDALYSDWMIHSPAVPVFRDDESGELLEEPYECAFLTAPAPRATAVLERDPSRRAEVDRVMTARITRALAICAAEGHSNLVLGAWGCGVFGNDPEVVARAFGLELEGAFAGVFEEVIFAVLDWSEERRFIRPFVARFAS
jgi:uncharacterized protein (TIGR02452 family)